MASIQQEQPPSYMETDVQSLVLPSVPTQELPSRTTQNPPISLPDLKSLGLPITNTTSTQLKTAQSWTITPPQSAFSYSTTPFAPASLPPPPSPMEVDGIMSDNRKFRAPSIMSLDDPETREAAETLSGLRNMDFKRAPSVQSSTNTIQPLSRDEYSLITSEMTREEDPEPLLSLITSSHPWIGGTINTSIYAYNSTMHYTPAIIQSLIEKNVNTVASGLGTVSRRTGVEGRVRQYFGDTPERRTARENARVGQKRTREHSLEPFDLEKGLGDSQSHSRQRSRTGSQGSYAETLPAYDENSAPEYQRHSELALQNRNSEQTWKTKLMITTSGLGVALSDTSLRSLKYCLSLLRQASAHLAEVILALRSLLVDYEQTVYGAPASSQNSRARINGQLTAEQEAASEQIAERIKDLGNDIMSTIQRVTSAVSRYTGGALPENAGALVRRQLLSVPQRWRYAEQASTQSSQQQASGSSSQGRGEALRTGQRFLVFAEQGCDMIAQVSLVVSGTVESAEKWLESMGRRKNSLGEAYDQKTYSGLPSPRGGMPNASPPSRQISALQMTEKR
ncbi:Opi1-domain-containing protein [Microthyrium microscopicum]|uniref:Opi1-domain-containing protein n=1 Tax=Microthyrium microscopicum TaxID=703497 RepID=A0A6A6TWV9_9PEZI|nr:Opi1-domain-containing protein [Microthyrium microscopicum]